MNQEQLNRLLDDTSGYVDASKLEAYLAGKLSPEEAHAVEAASLSSPLSEEALDGFSEFPEAIADLPELMESWNNAHNTSIKPAKGGQWGWWLTFTGAFVLAASYFLAPTTVESYAPPAEPIVQIEHFMLPDDQTVDQAIASEASELAEATPENTSTPDAEPASITTAADKVEESQNEPMEPVTKIEGAASPDVAVPEEAPKKKVRNARFPILYIENYKVVNYTAMSTVNRALEFQSYSGGTPAKYESGEKMDLDEPLQVTTYRAYEEVVENGILKFQAGRYRAALDKFKLIASQQPEDVNAHFYGGLCYYHLRKHNKSIQSLDLVLDSPVNTFHQEARWYRALALIEKGDKKAAIVALKEVIAEAAFYAERAQEKLTEINR